MAEAATKPQIDAKTLAAINAFLHEARQEFPITRAILFGSRARQMHHPDSDCDLAVVLSGQTQPLLETILRMSDLAFDVLLETDILIQPLPIWESQWQNPETFNNPRLLANVRHEGIPI
jgi:predicted nucleotidyltransferase